MVSLYFPIFQPIQLINEEQHISCVRFILPIVQSNASQHPAKNKHANVDFINGA